ncbi:MAG: TIR domain-containing protein [Candidatus Kentron sp. G]|nr:MAG: TIR domain-containing protein [Candidatus Kentron sp. G]VFN02552.1 MAG: TIR domain-containing protein [Candidatus Kentron sp. G]VFN03924.1 MAG: TIR domain-containing protein [Candidatus Kentron sp. G]
MTGKNRKVFISHSYEDSPWVAEFASALKTSGVKAWSDAEILPGENWPKKIEEALRESSTLVMVLSQNNIQSRWMFFELGAAVADEKRIIPVLLDDMDVTRIPIPLRQFQPLRESSPQAAGKRVAEVLDKNPIH